MNFRRKTVFAFGLTSALILGGFAAEQARAQSDTRSGVAERYLDSIRYQNSASRYSVGNIARQNLNSNVSSVGVPGVNRRSFLGSGGSRRPASKPFSSITRGPTVSPYLALNNSFNSANDYYSIVRPQQEQRRRNEQLQRQIQLNQRRIGEFTAKAPYSPLGNAEAAPTGHAAAFLSTGAYLQTGNYFPPPTAPKSQR